MEAFYKQIKYSNNIQQIDKKSAHSDDISLVIYPSLTIKSGTGVQEHFDQIKSPLQEFCFVHDLSHSG